MAEPAPIAAVLLAAGGSRRLGRPKQLVELGGKTLVRRAAEAARAAGFAPIYAVVGAYADAVFAEVAALGAVRVENAAFAAGIASSIRAGIAAVESAAPHAAGALLLAVDQPHVDAELLRSLRVGFESAGGGRPAACAYRGTIGIPALFPPALFAELRALHGDRGAKAILEARRGEILEVSFPGGEVDLDTEEDLARLRDRQA